MVLANAQYMQAKDEFLSMFVLCEIACKSVIEQYKKAINETVELNSIKLDMRSIPPAFSLFQYEIEKHILSSIFGASKKRGKKSAKKLRDGIVHNLSEEDIKEVMDRKEELLEHMNAFLKTIAEDYRQEKKENLS